MTDKLSQGTCQTSVNMYSNEYIPDFIERTNIKDPLVILGLLIKNNILADMKLENRNVTFSQIEDIIINPNNCNVDFNIIESAINSKRAYVYLLSTYESTHNLEYICNLQAISAASEALIPGAIRTGQVSISGTDYMPPTSINKNWVEQEYNKILTIPNTKERALQLFLFITKNQIFWDGNKRAGILAANKELLHDNEDVLSLNGNDMSDFHYALHEWYENDNEDLMRDVFNKYIYKFNLESIK